MHHGVDLSSYQPSVNFTQLREEGYRFVYIKATQSTNYHNPFYITHQAQAREAGLHTGFYHYLDPKTPSTAAAHAEADFFYSHVKGIGKGKTSASKLLRLAVDVETSRLNAVSTLSYIERFLDRLSLLAKHSAVVYTYPEFLAYWGNRIPKHHALWISDPNGRSTPDLPEPFTRWSIWQHDTGAHIAPVQGVVDLNKAPILKGLILDRNTY